MIPNITIIVAIVGMIGAFLMNVIGLAILFSRFSFVAGQIANDVAGLKKAVLNGITAKQEHQETVLQEHGQTLAEINERCKWMHGGATEHPIKPFIDESRVFQ
jgi:hypothetical protein